MTYTYRANNANVADLDSNGEYEVILKWNRQEVIKAFDGQAGQIEISDWFS
ncbi:rhamnogalacturonan lyase family protein [Ectobacillus funiculus]|uniref:rhamnogalacturonan lyase family protein n=1 Tax=Ectobacillus funiculus TaxID=137993 RepID=UPI003979688F